MQALNSPKGARRAGDACFLIARSFEPGACKLSPRDNSDFDKRNLPRGSHNRYARLTTFSISSGVSWDELTSSKLMAPRYDVAGKHALIPYPLSLIPDKTSYISYKVYHKTPYLGNPSHLFIRPTML